MEERYATTGTKVLQYKRDALSNIHGKILTILCTHRDNITNDVHAIVTDSNGNKEVYPLDILGLAPDPTTLKIGDRIQVAETDTNHQYDYALATGSISYISKIDNTVKFIPDSPALQNRYPGGITLCSMTRFVMLKPFTPTPTMRIYGDVYVKLSDIKLVFDMNTKDEITIDELWDKFEEIIDAIEKNL